MGAAGIGIFFKFQADDQLSEMDNADAFFIAPSRPVSREGQQATQPVSILGGDFSSNGPAELYFADLDTDWDADGDGLFGERGDDVTLEDLRAPELAVGASVQAGDLLGTIDVLGISQEVSAPSDGIVARVLAEDGQAVEYGQALAEIDPLEVDVDPLPTSEEMA